MENGNSAAIAHEGHGTEYRPQRKEHNDDGEGSYRICDDESDG